MEMQKGFCGFFIFYFFLYFYDGHWVLQTYLFLFERLVEAIKIYWWLLGNWIFFRLVIGSSRSVFMFELSMSNHQDVERIFWNGGRLMTGWRLRPRNVARKLAPSGSLQDPKVALSLMHPHSKLWLLFHMMLSMIWREVIEELLCFWQFLRNQRLFLPLLWHIFLAGIHQINLTLTSFVATWMKIYFLLCLSSVECLSVLWPGLPLASRNMTWVFMLLPEIWQNCRMQIFCNVLPQIWADCYLLIYTHCWELMKSVSGYGS